MPYGPERPLPLRIRAGVDIPEFGGMSKERDAAVLGPHEFQNLENVKFAGNKVANRDGLTKVNSSGAMTGSVVGIAHEKDSRTGAGGPTVYFTLGVNDGTLFGHEWFAFDPTMNDQIQRIQAFEDADSDVYSAGANRPLNLFLRYDPIREAVMTNVALEGASNPYYPVRNWVATFSRPVTIDAADSIDTGQVAPMPFLALQVDTNPALSYYCVAYDAVRVAGVELFSRSGYATPGTDIIEETTVFRSDGSGLVEEDVTAAIDAAIAASETAAGKNAGGHSFSVSGLVFHVLGDLVLADGREWRTDLISGLPDLYSDFFLARSTAGAWSYVAYPTPVLTNSVLCVKFSIEFQGKLYLFGRWIGTTSSPIAGTDTGVLDVYEWSGGATMTSVNQDPTTDTTDGRYVGGVVVGDTLYYCRRNRTGSDDATAKALIGTFDGTTWTDDAYTVNTSGGTYNAGWYPIFFVELGTKVYCGLININSGTYTEIHVLYCEKASIGNTWVLSESLTTDMLRYSGNGALQATSQTQNPVVVT